MQPKFNFKGIGGDVSVSKYYESEVPVTIMTSSNVVRFYRDAQKLSIDAPPFTDDAKALHLGALLKSDATELAKARAVFSEIVQRIDERLNQSAAG